MITDVLQGILDCAKDALDPTPGWASIVPGSEAVLEECCQGQLWTRLISLTPLYDRNCVMGWEASVEVGMVRCVATLDDRGNPPTREQIEDDAIAMMKDVEALQKALLCCPKTVKYVELATLESWQPYGPESGCAGGTWSLVVRIPDCGC